MTRVQFNHPHHHHPG
ncbi:his operon leader peptide [Serratia symbiotica]|uniref:his operon leader peptide n=2 Tax=Serratia symbiotica TaxID=138074 RepID=A0A7D5NW89_9GAMM|nr:his operon leader peptide [Serratia symbiotica]MBQ0956185.1 his operon leader peptide [Serratia symbiotica]NIH11924.1 his operon leader peptide [Serratia symbiotica]QLH64345.1 his operon leader peptide [Serratia symbiotica]CDG48033.1 Putative His operon leader peptide [Serratia symbiotica SCt-VLC]